jgi:hypothetical protein
MVAPTRDYYSPTDTTGTSTYYSTGIGLHYRYIKKEPQKKNPFLLDPYLPYSKTYKAKAIHKIDTFKRTSQVLRSRIGRLI